MKITSYEVMENLNSAISDYNQKFNGKEKNILLFTNPYNTTFHHHSYFQNK